MSEDTDPSPATGKEPELRFCRPDSTDGAQLHRLIASCPPLDTNSLYCNLLQCHHFADTAVKVESAAGDMLGFVSGYVPPGHDNTLFVWQVAVAEQARGQNLGVRMIRQILARPECRQVDTVHTTITPGNAASWGLFLRLAQELGCDHSREILFDRDRHFAGGHDDEILMIIGPFARSVA